MEERTPGGTPPPPKYVYKAFISYSHSADGTFAPSLQHSLQQFAKPWHRLRAIRIFRDQTGLTVTPSLWKTIVTAMDSAEYFLLLASPQAAASHWVNEEVRHWLSQPRAERLLILVTDGTIVWNAGAGGPDRDRTDALPDALCSTAEEPLWLDLRWARHKEQLSLQHPMWRDAIANLSSTLRGLPKDQLIGEDVRQHTRATRLRRAAIAGLALLTLALGIAAVLAIQQRDLAREQARIALARQLAAQAELIRAQQPERLPLALLMAAEGVRSHADSIETQQTLQGVLSLLPSPVATFTHQAGVAFADISPNRELVATAAGKDSALWRVSDRGRVTNLDSADRMVLFSPDGTYIAGCCQPLTVWTSAGQPVLRVAAPDLQGDPETVIFSPDSMRLAVGLNQGSTVGVVVFDLATKRAIFRSQTTLSGRATAVAFAPNGDLAMGFRDTIEIVSGATWLPLRTLSPDTGGVDRLAFHPRGRYLASSSSTVVSVFDLTSGTRAARLQIRSDAPGEATALAFSGTGQYLAAVGSFAGAIWDVAQWREAVYVRHGEFLTLSSLSFSDTSREAVSCGWDGACIGWSLETGARIHQFAHQHAYAADHDRKRSIFRGAFARQSDLLLTAGADGTARLWDLAPANQAGRVPCEGNLLVWRYLPRGRTWSIQGGPLELVYRACRPGKPDERRFDRSVIDAPSGTHSAAVVPGDIVRVWATESGKVTAEFSDAAPIDWEAVQRRLTAAMSARPAATALQRLQAGSVTVVAVSSSGRFIATHRGADGAFRIWDAPASRVLHTEVRERAPLVEFLSDVDMLRVDDRGQVSVVQIADGAPKWTESLNQIRALAVSDDGRRIMAAAQDQEASLIRVWDAASGKRLVDQRVDGEVGELVFDRSARFAAVLPGPGLGVPEGLPQGAGLKIWDVSTAREVVALPESQGVVGLAFSPDARHVAIVLRTGTLLVHDLVSGDVRQTVGASAGPVAFSSHGRWIAFGSRALRVLDAESLQVVAQVDGMTQARRVEFRTDDRVLAIDVSPDGDPRGVTHLVRWMPADVLADACRVLPLQAAVRQWAQLFPGAPAPSPCRADTVR